MSISKEDIALYDRQIRVWGMEAQLRMKQFRVLVAGVSGVSVEVAKNLVLAGIGHVTLLDHRALERRHLSANFLARADALGHNVGTPASSC